jgi:hypothetical protein
VSAFDVSATAKAWLDAIAAKEASEDAFRDNPQGLPLEPRYREMILAQRAEDDARRAHLASLRDAPNAGEPDDARIARLRNEKERLLEQVRALRREVTTIRKNNEERNRELDALHYVWCDGGCQGGTHRWAGSPDDVTEEIVALAERNTKRLRSWFINRQSKKARGIT